MMRLIIGWMQHRSTKLLLLLLLVTACGGTPQPQQPVAAGNGSGTPHLPVSAAEKIAVALRQVVQRLHQDGVTAANVATRQAEAYTTPLVRVDPGGRLHVVMQVTLVNAQVQTRLEEHQVRIEHTEPALRLIQAWVPFDRLEDVAAMPFVQHVRPPSYVVRH